MDVAHLGKEASKAQPSERPPKERTQHRQAGRPRSAVQRALRGEAAEKPLTDNLNLHKALMINPACVPTRA